jgi:hypothetical protein
MSLYSLLAAAPTRGTKDGDFFLPNQKGSMVLHGVIYLNKGPKQTAILVGEIVDSHAKVAGAKTQAPGTKVKKVYALSKREWAIAELKTDLVRIMGLDEKALAPNQIAEIFADVFEGEADKDGKRGGPNIEKSILRGVITGFDTSQVDRSAKRAAGNAGAVDLTDINFFEISAGNTAEEVAARKTKMDAELKKAA